MKINKAQHNVDLFEDQKNLPKNVVSLIKKHFGSICDDFSVENCRSLVLDLRAIGYKCEYSLDGVPYGLVKII